MNNNIKMLLLAAEYLDKQERCEYLDKQERDTEHGYACVLQPPRLLGLGGGSGGVLMGGRSCLHKRRRRRSSRSNGPNRSSHNELEKNRRAHMRHCFEQLKKVVPLSHDAARHTTQGLLTKAAQLISALEMELKANIAIRDDLRRTERFLLQRVPALHGSCDSSRSSCSSSGTSSVTMRSMIHRTYSESSGSSSNALSTSPTSETEQIDVVGYSGVTDISNDMSVIGSTDVIATRDITRLSRRGGNIGENLVVMGGDRKRRSDFILTRGGGGGGMKRRCSDSGSDVDDVHSQASVDSGCGLSPCSNKIMLDSL